jgi:predicted permease
VASLLGLGLAAVLVALLRKGLAGEVGAALLPTLDLGVVAFDAALAAAAALLFGLGPALATAGRDLTGWLRQRGEAAPRRRLHRVLVVLEVTLALVMLSATGLLITSLRAMRTLDSGFAERGLATFMLKLPPRYAEADLAVAAERLSERLAAAPGVARVAAASALPRTRGVPTLPFAIEGEEAPEGTRPATTVALSVASSYFDTLEIPRRAGRWFSATDRAEAPAVAVVSAEFARRYLGGQAIGRRVIVDGRSREVVGVAGDVVQTRTLEEGGLRNPIVYLPLAQQPARQLGFLVRTAAAPGAFGDLVRRETAAFDPLLVTSQPRTMREVIDAQFGGARVFSALLAGFAGIALALAALGVYGVVAYAVARRRREIGVRIAVGARPADVVRHFAGQGAALAGIGLALAVPAVLLVARAVAAIFHGNFPMVWLSLPAIAAVLGATAALASWLPARRAARLDPAAVLAGE